MNIDQALLQNRILVCCGTGGVGKTTLSAALAIRGAQLGKKTLVITMDPAKRLSTSLGGIALGDEPTALTERLHSIQKANSPQTDGELWAVVPNTQKTFEKLVQDLGFEGGSAERILSNPIFKIFAREFSGTNEYMAMQKLYAHYKNGKFDLIILDTPPSRNTLDFLRAPQLLARFYEDKIFQWLVIPTSALLSIGIKKGIQLLEKLTGSGFMTHLMGFAQSLFEVRTRFTANLARVLQMLESPETGFLLIASPDPQIRHFLGQVKERKLRFKGILLNRTLGHLDLTTLRSGTPEYEVLRSLQDRERRGTAAVADLLHSENYLDSPLLLPELIRDIHSLEDLTYVSNRFAT
jgi:anion-transporting  ArsA/GET3 family ATPase